jgi:hypothetical protein
MEVIRYCPFCKVEHEVTYEGTYCVQCADKGILRAYRCNKVNKVFRKKEYDTGR